MTTERIYTIHELAEISAKLKKKGKTVAYCHGEFDLLHFGHLRHFKEAAQQADYLIVTVTPDKFINKGPGRPVYNENYRAEFISSLKCVAYAGINEWATAENSLKAIQPSVYCKGNEYIKKKDVTGRITVEKDLVESLGGRLHFTEDVVFSSSELSKQHFNVFSEDALEYLKGFCEKYHSQQITDKLEALTDLNVMVVGSSQLVTEPILNTGKDFEYSTEKRTFATGAIQIANQLAHFCGSVTLINEGETDPDDLLDFLDNRVLLVNQSGQKHVEEKTNFSINVQTNIHARINGDDSQKTFILSNNSSKNNENGISFEKSGATHVLLDGKKLTVPAFSGKSTSSEAVEAQTFAVTACGYAAKWEPEVLAFLTAASFAMAKENQKNKRPLERMPLSKYLIALMK